MDFFPKILWLRERQWIGYAVAILGALLGMAAHAVLGGALSAFPFVSFFPAVMLAALIGGWVPGLIALAVSAALADYFLIAPRGFDLSWPNGWIGMISFVGDSVAMTLLIDFAMRMSTRLVKAMRLLREMNDRLDERVAERTRELTMLTAQLREEIQTKESAEAQVRQMQKMETLGQLTGGIAHDFNNMLAIVMGSLELIRRRMAQGRGDIGALVDNAMDGAKRAATLTHQLLAFSRRQPLAPTVVDISVIVSAMAEMLRRVLGATIDLECVLAGGLWRAHVDPGQLESAILNLAINARDAMPERGRLTIETQNAYLDDTYAASHAEVTRGQYVLIAVTDTGAGMPPDVVARAFDPFFTTKPAGRGTGLGLSQVYGFIKQSEGHIKIYSEVGHGTSVKIYLPRYTGGTAVETHARETAVETAMPLGRAEETVLVVEDDDAVRRIHVGMLRDLNYTVYHAANGAEAIALLRDRTVGLLFTDVIMPGMGGRELAERARRFAPGIKVLFTTGYTPNAIVHNGVVDSGVDMLSKPFAHDQLARKVRAVLDRR